MYFRLLWVNLKCLNQSEVTSYGENQSFILLYRIKPIDKLTIEKIVKRNFGIACKNKKQFIYADNL